MGWYSTSLLSSCCMSASTSEATSGGAPPPPPPSAPPPPPPLPGPASPPRAPRCCVSRRSMASAGGRAGAVWGAGAWGASRPPASSGDRKCTDVLGNTRVAGGRAPPQLPHRTFRVGAAAGARKAGRLLRQRPQRGVQLLLRGRRRRSTPAAAAAAGRIAWRVVAGWPRLLLGCRAGWEVGHRAGIRPGSNHERAATRELALRSCAAQAAAAAAAARLALPCSAQASVLAGERAHLWPAPPEAWTAPGTAHPAPLAPAVLRQLPHRRPAAALVPHRAAPAGAPADQTPGPPRPLRYCWLRRPCRWEPLLLLRGVPHRAPDLHWLLARRLAAAAAAARRRRCRQGCLRAPGVGCEGLPGRVAPPAAARGQPSGLTAVPPRQRTRARLWGGQGVSEQVREVSSTATKCTAGAKPPWPSAHRRAARAGPPGSLLPASSTRVDVANQLTIQRPPQGAPRCAAAVAAAALTAGQLEFAVQQPTVPPTLPSAMSLRQPRLGAFSTHRPRNCTSCPCLALGSFCPGLPDRRGSIRHARCASRGRRQAALIAQVCGGRAHRSPVALLPLLLPAGSRLDGRVSLANDRPERPARSAPSRPSRRLPRAVRSKQPRSKRVVRRRTTAPRSPWVCCWRSPK